MTDFSIRPAEPGDIPAIAAIYDEAVLAGTASFEIVPPGAAEMARRMTKLCEGGYPYFVAEGSGTVLGYGYTGLYRERIAYRNTVEDSIYIDEKARGRGIGRALLSILIERCEALGFRQMIAVIGDSSHVASIRLHQAAGFELVGAFKDVGYKHGRWLDTVLMQRVLGPGASTPPDRPGAG